MDAPSIIKFSEQMGIQLSMEGDRIAIRPISKLNSDLRDLIRAHRADVTQLLSFRQISSDLTRIAIESGVFDHGYQLSEQEISTLLSAEDLTDVSECSQEEMRAWAFALALRAVRFRGKVPQDWDQVAHCVQCGPVYSFAAGDYLSCLWCEVKRAGKWFPTPTTQEFSND